MPGKDLFAEPEKRKGKDLFASPAAQSPLQRDINAAVEARGPMADKPARTGKNAHLDRKNEIIRADHMARQAYQAQVDEERKARMAPIDERADAAAAQARTEALSNFDSPLEMAMGANAMFMAGFGAGEDVYQSEGTMSPAMAYGLRTINSSTLGIPSFVNKDFREDVGIAGRDRPGAALAGDVTGFFIPGEAAWQGGRAVTNALAPTVTRIMPKGGSHLARTARFTGRFGTQSGAWAGQNALFQGTVGESTRAAEEGRDPSFVSAVQAAQQGATDPINAIGPAALMGLNRLFTYARTGGRTATPQRIQDEVGVQTGGQSGSGTVLDAGLVGGPVDGRAERLLVRMLGDVGYSSDDIRAALAAFDQAANETTNLPTLAARLKDVFIDQLGPRAEQVVQDFLQGAGVSRGGTAGQAVADAAQQDYGRLSDFLEASANARLGQGSRWDTLTGAQDEMTRIGNEGYERVFGAPTANPEGVEELRRALDFYAGSELATPLRQVAAGRMLSVEQMIAADPRRAAHWMQHTANLRAQEAADAGNEVVARAYRDMRDQIIRRLEADGVAPGYQQARMQFGDQFGIEQAINFGSRFFTRVQDSVGVRQLAEDLRNLTPEQQEAALLSIRDELLRIAGRHREGAAPRLSQVNTEQALGGLETVIGEQGGQLANDIRFIEERLARIRRTDPAANSRTTSNTEARAFADRAVSNPIVRQIGNALNAIGGDAALASVASGGTVPPIFSIRAAARGMGDRLARGRQGKIDDVTALLLRDVGPTARPGAPGDNLPPLESNRGPSGGTPPPAGGLGEISSNGRVVEQPRNALSESTPGSGPYFGRRSFREDDRGVIAAELASTLGGGSGGGAIGYLAPAESEEQRQFNALLGAAGGLGGGIQGARMIDDAVMSARLARSRAADRAAREIEFNRQPPVGGMNTNPPKPSFANSVEELENTIFAQAPHQRWTLREVEETLQAANPADVAKIARKHGIQPPEGWEMTRQDWVDAVVQIYQMSRPKAHGFAIPTIAGDTAVSGLVGTGGGSIYGSRNDVNDDGRIDGQDMFLGSLAGGALFLGGPQAWQAGRNALADIATAGPSAARPPLTLGKGQQVSPEDARLLNSIRDQRMLTEGGDPIANARHLDDWQVPPEQAAFPMGPGGQPLSPEQLVSQIYNRVLRQVQKEQTGREGLRRAMAEFGKYATPAERRALGLPDDFQTAREAGRVSKEERAVLFGDDDPKPMGFAAPKGSGRRPSGFLDEMERGSEPFHDPRLGPEGSPRNKAVEMARNGHSNDEIAEELETTTGTVKVWLSNARKLGIDIPAGYRPGGLAKTETGTSADIMRLVDQGLSVEQISQRTGKSPANIRSMISRAKAQPRNALAE